MEEEKELTIEDLLNLEISNQVVEEEVNDEEEVVKKPFSMDDLFNENTEKKPVSELEQSIIVRDNPALLNPVQIDTKVGQLEEVVNYNETEDAIFYEPSDPKESDFYIQTQEVINNIDDIIKNPVKLPQSTRKESLGWKEVIPGVKSGTLSCECLTDYSDSLGFDQLADMVITKQKATFYFKWRNTAGGSTFPLAWTTLVPFILSASLNLYAFSDLGTLVYPGEFILINSLAPPVLIALGGAIEGLFAETVFDQKIHAFAVILFNTGFWLQLNMLTKAGDLLPVFVTSDAPQFGFKLLLAKIFKK